jgi:1-phosphofructokinase
VEDRSIVTVGICPCWDIICHVEGLTWGDHKIIGSQQSIPAGKAMNISRALWWLGVSSVAGGLWGASDYEQMLDEMSQLRKLVDIRFTKAPGRTRQNITVVDTLNKREMHLRAQSRLGSVESLRKLSADLISLVRPEASCVFAGSMPDDNLLDEVISIITKVRSKNGKIVIDTSGKALKRIVDSGDIWIVKPNVEELRFLVGADIGNNTQDIIAAARGICDRARIVLVSRGQKGAIAVTADTAVKGVVRGDKLAASTVGCGDYLLAGFLGGDENLDDGGQLGSALTRAIKTASARAWGLCDKMSWADVEKEIEVEITEVG